MTKEKIAETQIYLQMYDKRLISKKNSTRKNWY